MSQFVNYKKRSFTLPQGCKDLIDILQPSRRQTKECGASPSFEIPVIKQDHFRTAGLVQIGRYVSMLLDSPAELFTLMVTYRDDQFPVVLYRSNSDSIFAIVLLAKDTERERAIRAFFSQRGVPLLQNYSVSDIGPQAGRGLIYRLLLDASQATSLTTDLFRGVYGFNDVAGIDFSYYEVEKPVA